MLTASATGLVTPDHLRQFHRDGYFLLPNALGEGDLDLLRAECARGLAESRAGVEARLKVEGDQPDRRAFLENMHFFTTPEARWPGMDGFWHGEVMAAITRAVLGDDVYLFYEQFVVKTAERGASFAWHQDSGYVGHPHTPYLTLWIALDDVSEANGTVRILPHPRSPVRGLVQHQPDARTWERVGYDGDDPGEPAILPAGGIAVFSSLTFHCSTTNPTSRPRRAYIAQYAPTPIMNADGSKLWNRAEPIIRGGKRVRGG